MRVKLNFHQIWNLTEKYCEISPRLTCRCDWSSFRASSPGIQDGEGKLQIDSILRWCWAEKLVSFLHPKLYIAESTKILPWFGPRIFHIVHIDGLVQERRNSSALAMELWLSCNNPSTSILNSNSPKLVTNYADYIINCFRCAKSAIHPSRAKTRIFRNN